MEYKDNKLKEQLIQMGFNNEIIENALNNIKNKTLENIL